MPLTVNLVSSFEILLETLLGKAVEDEVDCEVLVGKTCIRRFESARRLSLNFFNLRVPPVTCFRERMIPNFLESRQFEERFCQ